MSDIVVQDNDLVFLILDERRRWLVQVEKGKEFHSHRGIIKFDDIIGKSFGTVVFSHPHETQGYKFYVLKPLPSDYVIYMGRKTQIIYPEDAGLIIMYSGIKPGSKVIEAGCGSGALTCILGTYVQPNGHIYSYDIREKSLRTAVRNITRANLQEYISIKYGDILVDELDHENIDSVILDMPQPWEAISKVKKYLKLSGTLVSFSPTIEQVKKTTFALQRNDFTEIYTYELIKRTLQVKENATRPQVRMIGHTGYITLGRKILEIKNPYRERKPKNFEKVSLDGMPLKE
ncbi:MAG: tRNA (adenine-N1)-methyltransferase [Candidatus Lokiarchaeota archaeon]|jgi:tRNA (adenine57-N1/adenine58-N1)-methyltransferase|nr:tRNA (adenine-N1)-methyltransferase [Candidatus Lokiarchaeota archaeon]